jgi:glycerol-3-phosphate acyltransferase PlsY
MWSGAPWTELGPAGKGLLAASAALAGYLAGSASPAYLLGRLLRGIDIRKQGYGNAGTRNVYHLLGLFPAALTAVVDLGKGILAVWVAWRLLGLPGPGEEGSAWLIAPAAAAILGHLFPFYLRFRGGRGVATSVGIYLFFCILAMTRRQFAPASLAAVLAGALLVFLASRSGDLTSLAAFAFLAVVTSLETGLTGDGPLMFLLSVYLFAMGVRNAAAQRVFDLDRSIEMKWWRTIARPFALLFIPIDLLAGRRTLLWLLASVAIVVIGTDIFRLLSRHELRRLFKKKELKRFSSMTSFIVAIFIVFLVFPDWIPYLALGFITIGDMFSKIIGLKFGRHRLVGERTLEGSLGFLSGCFMTGWVLHLLLPIPVYVLLAGAVFATAVEVFSMDLDDNFTVGILTGGFLFALRYFLQR